MCCLSVCTSDLKLELWDISQIPGVASCFHFLVYFRSSNFVLKVINFIRSIAIKEISVLKIKVMAGKKYTATIAM